LLFCKKLTYFGEYLLKDTMFHPISYKSWSLNGIGVTCDGSRFAENLTDTRGK